MYVLNKVAGDADVIVIGRDSAASGDTKYSVAPGGFTLQGAVSVDLALGGIAILRYAR